MTEVAARLKHVEWGDDGTVFRVVFADTKRPDIEVVVSIVVIITTPDDPRGKPDPFGDNFNEITQCVGVEFRLARGETAPVPDRNPLAPLPELSPRWVREFPLAWCVEHARLAALDEPIGGESAGALRLPPGLPGASRSREWYLALGRSIDVMLANGFTPMEAYRHIAARKRVDPNRVKQWAKRARDANTAQSHKEKQ